MKKQFQKVIALLLVVVLAVPVFAVPAFALTGWKYEPELNWFQQFSNGAYSLVKSALPGFAGSVLDFERELRDGMLLSQVGKVSSRRDLENIAANYNDKVKIALRQLVNPTDLTNVYRVFGKAVVTDCFTDAVTGEQVLRLVDGPSGLWITDSQGRFPYAIVNVKGDTPSSPATPPNVTPDTSPERGNQWLSVQVLEQKNAFSRANVLTHESLSNLARKVGAGLVSYGSGAKKVYVVGIIGNQTTMVYCNALGHPWVSSGPAAPSVTDVDFTYIDASTNETTNIGQVLNMPDAKFEYKEGDKQDIFNVTYNFEDNSYTANTYNYDITNNTYNYYTWNITYNITNTYINYIGSNSAYQQEEYKYYYELPDGRSSADLTAEEVGAMSFQFADVKNYARSAIDTSLRALYHFDGNTEDAGYFSTQTAFKWVQGASITYMDSAGFGGALYMDETNHNFDITLPSNLGTKDFSVQFRHYQASQPDTLDNINNSFSIGGIKVMTWDERSFYWPKVGTATPTALAPVPIGSWHELAFIREGGMLRFYVNGIQVASKADTTSYTGKLNLTLGATSRAYTMFDELRAVNFPIVKSGAAYQCTTVPYDTNLVLVLPDGAYPVADEYYDVTFPADSLLKIDFSQVGNNYFNSSAVVYGDGSISLPVNPSIYSTINFPLAVSTGEGRRYFTCLFADGTVATFLFELWNDSEYARWYLSTVPLASQPNSSFASRMSIGFSGYSISFRFNASVTPFSNIVAAALTKSLPTSDVFKAEKVSCIYSSDELKSNTAAVQSSIPVTGYTVGGVRPTFPQRGNVWFPVEGRRISGCYIYDGSMWRVAGARYYTGTRWIPIYAFDIYTLADCWDVADGGIDPTPPITSESGFWNWWKKEWTDFRNWLKSVLQPGSGVPGQPGASGAPGVPGVPGSGLDPIPGEDGEEKESWSLWDIAKKAVDAVWKLLDGLFSTVFGGIGSFFSDLVFKMPDFFNAFKGSDGVRGIFEYGGGSVWD